MDVQRRLNYFVEGFRMGLSPRFFETGAQFAGADYFIPLGSVLSNLSYVTSGLGVSVLATGTRVRGFKPGRSRRTFQGEKILSTPSFGREVKQFVSCRRFTACKRSLNVTWKSHIFRQNSSAISRPRSSSFHYYGRKD